MVIVVISIATIDGILYTSMGIGMMLSAVLIRLKSSS